MLLLLLAAHLAQADTWSSTVGAQVQNSPDATWLRVESSKDYQTVATVETVIRGDRVIGDTVEVTIQANAGSRILHLCGAPHAEVCLVAIESDGLVWLHPVAPIFDSPGHIPPGVSTPAHIEAMLQPGPVPTLCVQIGTTKVHVDARTGEGKTPAGQPLGVTAASNVARIDYFDPNEPVYVGRAGHTTLSGVQPRWQNNCVTYHASPTPDRPLPAHMRRVWLPRGLAQIREGRAMWHQLTMESDPAIIASTPGSIVGVYITWMHGSTIMLQSLTDDLQLATLRGPRADHDVDSVRIEIFETQVPTGHKWHPRSNGYKVLREHTVRR